MRKIRLLLLILIPAFAIFNEAFAQEKISPNLVKKPIGFSISKPLKDNPIITGFENQHEEFYMNKHRSRVINPNIKPPDFNKMPVDPNEQTEQGWINNSSKALNKNYAGQYSGSYPPDCNGTVGPNHYFQVVNTTYAIYNKSDGVRVAGPSALNSIFDSSLPGTGYNDGDPIVLWDEHANRWFFAEFSLGGSNDYMLIAVSTSADPTGTWYSWSYDVDDTPDYMKFGIWQDGYYMATNTSGGNDVYVFERDKMIAGDPNPQMIGFDNPNRPATFDGFHCIMPLDNDGAWAPSGTPGQFITIADGGQSNPADALYIYELDVNWTIPSNSTFARTQTINVNSFSGNFTGDWNNIHQPGTTQKLDGISTVLMYRAQYRNFSGTQKIVCTHTIAESSTESAIRWYELENTGSSWSIAQQGTYNPDNVSRWNASIAMNDLGQIGMGYSVSDGTSTYPGIRYCGQTSNAPANTMDIAETNIYTGQYSQSSYNRWGDYANISIDPSDGETFWFSSEYKSSSSHGTRIAAFTIDESTSCTPPSTQASNFSASSIGDNSMTISWTRGNGTAVMLVAHEGSAVNADPVPETSYTANSVFGSGSQIGTGNYVLYRGTGSSVSISGLNLATSYHFAVYEYNSADNCYNLTELTGNATTTGVSYCTSQGNNSTYEWIAGVEIGTFVNNSGAANYTDFTGTTVELAPGTSYDISLTPGFKSTTYNEYWKIWIDYNNDGDFTDSGELAFDAGSMSKTTVTGSIAVPSGASGSTRMRVSMKYNGEQSSCEAFAYGEVEDYTVSFTGPVNVPPVAEANGPYSGTEGVSVSFSSTGSSDSDGTITDYYWEFGDGGTSTSANPSHIYSTADSYTAVLTVTDNGGLTDSDNATVTINPASGGDYATIPYSTGFESGYDDNWSTQGSNSYSRIQLTTSNTPHSGSYHLTMDVTSNGHYCTNEAWMGLDLTGETQVDLSFWWKDFSDETHSSDGVYFSDNGGSSFVKVLDLNGASYTNNVWNEFDLDVDQLASANGLSLTSTFVVKFQQYDNYVIATDGMAFDDISVSAGSGGDTDPPTGYCASKGNNSSYEWIDLVQLGTINNTSGNDGGYEDYTSMSTDLIFGNEYTINFSCGFSSSSYTEYWHIFIDYNRDGDFDDAGEEVVAGSSSSSGTLAGTFTVPSNPSTGYTRMRVSMKYNASATSCETFTYGEVEDYLVYLTPTARSKNSVVYESGFEIGNEENMYAIYPNPSSDIINIRLPENSVIEARITNIDGKEVKIINLNRENSINITSLPAGIYIISIDDGRKTTIQKFVKY
ncbi:MAG: T9SS type A sorting domain-containing protein [Bacteroidales bacterium]|nr:T9SS type A sorting domain-containing protein [Bacteroidales bacterium]